MLAPLFMCTPPSAKANFNIVRLDIILTLGFRANAAGGDNGSFEALTYSLVYKISPAHFSHFSLLILPSKSLDRRSSPFLDSIYTHLEDSIAATLALITPSLDYLGASTHSKWLKCLQTPPRGSITAPRTLISAHHPPTQPQPQRHHHHHPHSMSHQTSLITPSNPSSQANPNRSPASPSGPSA